MKRFTLTTVVIAVFLAIFTIACNDDKPINGGGSNGGGHSNGPQTCSCHFNDDILGVFDYTFSIIDPPITWSGLSATTCSQYQQQYNAKFPNSHVSCSVVN
jgi:hypothetical protein